MGRASQAWKVFERKIAKEFEAAFGFEVRRAPCSGGWARSGRADARDAYETTGDLVAPATAEFPWIVECKRRKSWDIMDLFFESGELVRWWRDISKKGDLAAKVPLLIVSVPGRRLILVIAHIDLVSVIGVTSCKHIRVRASSSLRLVLFTWVEWIRILNDVSSKEAVMKYWKEKFKDV